MIEFTQEQAYELAKEVKRLRERIKYYKDWQERHIARMVRWYKEGKIDIYTDMEPSEK